MLAVLALLMVISAPSSDFLYHYKANIVSVYDGDTVTADIDLGMEVWIKGAKLRLYGIDAPEVRGPEKTQGIRSRDVLASMLADREVVVQTIEDKKGKYGRWLAVLWVKGKGQWCPVDNWCSANDYLVSTGFAVAETY